MAAIIAMYYTLHSAKQRDRVGLMRVLGILANCDRAFDDPFLHFLVSFHLLDYNITYIFTVLENLSFNTLNWSCQDALATDSCCR